jgi:hypothetical protein
MIQVHHGSTRTVVVCGTVAIKIPRRQVGFRCNLYEARIWELNRNHPVRSLHLCPVLWCASDGAALVMQAALPLPFGMDPDESWAEWWDKDYDPNKSAIDGWPGKLKAADWGILNGRRVLVDYAAPAIHPAAG